MKKQIVLSLAACMLIFTGCASKPASKPEGATPTPAAGDAKPASDAAPAKVKVMKLAVATAKERSLTKGLDKFAEIVQKETNGAIKVEVYPDAQLGGDVAVFKAMQAGTIEGSTISTGPIGTYAKRFNVFDLPFLFKNDQTAYEILDGPIGKELLNDLPSLGVIGINYFENGFRDLTNKKREVKSVNDIKGLKIRTLQSDIHIDIWKELGAIPTPMAITELFTALDQGVVDGQENPAGNVKTYKFNEVQKYLTKTGHIYGASPFMISKKFWDSLSDKERDIMTKAAEEAKTYERKLNQEEGKESYDWLAKNGMTITELSAEEKQKFFDKLQPVYKKYASTFGEDLVKKLVETNK